MSKRVAIQLRNYEKEDWRRLSRISAEAGFSYVAMAFGDPTPLLRDDWRDYVNEMVETFARLGLRCVQTHAPYYDLQISAEKRDADMETALFRMAEVTKMLGAELLAVHPRSFILEGEPRETTVDRARSFEENLISFRPLAMECERQGVLLGIENLMKYPFAYPYFYSWIAEDHAALIDALDSPAVCAVWDFGHANLVDTDHAARLRTLGSRIKGTHVHNNDGIEDCHFPPFLPPADGYYVRRTVDWGTLLPVLRSTGYEGYLTLEPVMPMEHAVEAYIRYLYESVAALDGIFFGT